MRLNENNFGDEPLKIDSSKITDRMDTRVAVISNNRMDSLAVKIYTVLKRDFSVIFTEKSPSGDETFPVLDICDTDFLEAFLIVHKIQAVVLTSEIVADCNDKIRLDAISDFKNVCKNHNVKIIYVSVKNIFRYDSGTYGIIGEKKQDKYHMLNKKTSEIVRSVDNNLVLEVSTFYGANEYADCLDFPAAAAGGRLSYEYDDSYGLFPLLSDEIAFYLSQNFDKSGFVSIGESNGAITEHKWASDASEAADIADFSVLGENEFSTAKTGYGIEKKQKNCIFHLVYKLSPMDFFREKRVAEIRIRLGKKLAETFPENISAAADCVIPVPKTGLYYAMGLAGGLGLPYVQALSKDTSEIRSFQVNDADVRKSIIKNKIIPIPELIEGKKIIVVDEAVFTGTTLKVVCKMLRKCKAEAIFLGIPTPKCRNQCPYYVQPKRAMLLEYVRDSMLEQYFDVDGIVFQNDSDFIAEMSEFEGVCMSCFFGGEKV